MKQLVILCFLSLGCVYCTRVKNNGKEIIQQTKNKVKRKAEELSDKICPKFDTYSPDTKYNKLRFKDFIKVDLTTDVKNIYCYGDEMGIDAKYQFSFTCAKETADKIIKVHRLKISKESTNPSLGLQKEFDWWKIKEIEKLDNFTWFDGRKYHKNFWYDKALKKAYFFDFDL